MATPSGLRAGNRLVAVEGVDILELQAHALRGGSADFSYRAGETVRYTVLRDGAERVVAVPLYPGLSLGAGEIARQLLNNQMGGPLLLAAILLVGFVFYRRPHHGAASSRDDRSEHGLGHQLGGEPAQRR